MCIASPRNTSRGSAAIRPATVTTSSKGMPNFAVFSPVFMYRCESIATSGLTRIPTRAGILTSLATAVRASSSLVDSMLMKPTRARIASSISAAVLPTPEKTMPSGSNPAMRTRRSSPTDTMSAPAPSCFMTRNTPTFRCDPRLPAAIPDRTLVRLCPHGLRYAGGSAPHAMLRHLFTAELGIGEHPDRRVRLLFDLGLARRAAAETAVGESAAALDKVKELCLGGAADRVLLAPLAGGSEQRCLDLLERFRDGGRCSLKRYRCFPPSPAGKNDLATREVARPDLQTDWYTEAFPLEVLGAGFHRVTQIRCT